MPALSVKIQTKNQTFEVTPTLTAVAYSAGDSLGGLLTLSTNASPTGGAAYIESICLSDLGSNDTEVDIVLFDEDPSSSTITNDAEVDIADGDIDKIIGVVTVYSSGYTSFADNSLAFKHNLGIPIVFGEKNTTLYAALIERGTPTRAVGDIILKINVVFLGE